MLDWLRLVWLFISYYIFGARNKDVVYYRVLPYDLDWNMHLNNAKYFTAMELGRIKYALGCGLWPNSKLTPLLFGISFRFRRAVKAFDCMKVTTKFLNYDERFVYLEQTCSVNGRCVGRGVAKVGFVDNKGIQSSDAWLPMLNDFINLEANEKVSSYIAHDNTLEE